MEKWKVSASGDRAFYLDDALGLSALVFSAEDRLYAAVTLKGFAVPDPYQIVLGPFVHFAAITDLLTGYLIRIDAEDDDGVFETESVPSGSIPALPAIPPVRLLTAEMMSPRLAADLLWEAQQILDSGEDPAMGVNLLEAAYLGDRYDETSLADYQAQCAFDLAAVPETVEVGPAPAPVVPVTVAQVLSSSVGEPIEIKPIATQPRISAVGLPPVPAVGQGRVTNMPRAAVPRTQPFVRADWSTLPVHVIEEMLSQELMLLRASWPNRRR